MSNMTLYFSILQLDSFAACKFQERWFQYIWKAWGWVDCYRWCWDICWYNCTGIQVHFYVVSWTRQLPFSQNCIKTWKGLWITLCINCDALHGSRFGACCIFDISLKWGTVDILQKNKLTQCHFLFKSCDTDNTFIILAKQLKNHTGIPYIYNSFV